MLDVARLWEWEYTLTAVADRRTRSGSLIRAEFVDGSVGHADLHVWPELGDTQEAIFPRTLELAREDALARTRGEWLLQGLPIPASHASLPFGFTREDLERVRAAGYRHVKVKTPVHDFAALRDSGLGVRVDFNSTAPDSSVLRDLEGVDWVEDPGPYDASLWRELRCIARIAADFVTAPEDAYDVRIVKPARERTPTEALPVAFTTYLGHPIASVHAARAAGEAMRDGRVVEVGGLTSHTAYQPDEFSERLSVHEGVLECPPGPGIGFDDLLDALPWRLIT